MLSTSSVPIKPFNTKPIMEGSLRKTMTLAHKLLALVALGAALLPSAAAHSWIEEYQVIGNNGSYVGDRGFARGYMSRTAPGYNGFSDEWMLPSLDARTPDGGARVRLNSSDLLCHPAQRSYNYTTDYPMLQVSPGDYVAMKYLENGHVTLPWNITGKPPGGGTIFVFGTTQPDLAGEKIADVMKWTADGSGGDQRGFLMTAQDFDDGRCHQLNCGSISEQRQMLQPNHVANQPDSTMESWCETDLQVPQNTQPGKLTVYWIWQWPTAPNMDCNLPGGKDEYYTTCADFEVVPAGSANKNTASTHIVAQENPQSVAVSDYMSRTAYTTVPSVYLMEGSSTVGSTPAADPTFVSQCSAAASVSSQYGLTGWPLVYVPNTCAVVSTFGSAPASSAAAAFSTAAASYTAQRSSIRASAFAAAGVKILADPTPAATSDGGSVSDSAANNTAPAAASAPASAAASSTSTAAALPTSTSSTATSVTVSIITSSVTVSYVTVTDTVTVTAGSASAPPSSSTSSSTAATSSNAAAAGASSDNTASASRDISFSTITVAGSHSAAYANHPSSLPHAQRRHPRNFSFW